MHVIELELQQQVKIRVGICSAVTLNETNLLQLHADAEVAITTAGKCLAPWLTHEICMPQAN